MPTRYRRDKHEDADLYMTKDEQKSPARGTQYGREMSQRPAASTSRTMSNYQPTVADLVRVGKASMDAARRLNLSGGQEMELMQNGYTDVGDWRYQIDRSSGEVSRSPKPGSRWHQNGPTKYQMQYGYPKSMGQEVSGGD